MHKLLIKMFIKRNRLPIDLSIAIYFISFLLGTILFYLLNSKLPNPSNPFNTVNGLGIVQGDSTTLTFLQNNGMMVLILISGSFLLGSITSINLIFNGFVFGMAIAGMLHEASLTMVLLMTLPHAIFELPGIWIAGAAGFKIPYELARYFTEKKNYILNREEVIDFLILIGCAVVLIIISAIIEANVTMRIAETFSKR